jgi:hypothetical protein
VASGHFNVLAGFWHDFSKSPQRPSGKISLHPMA